MHDALSPYALLCASKPSPAPVLVTPYDLYSQAQQSSAPVPADSLPAPQPEAKPTAAPSPLARRTHYISDIQSRHNTAMRKTPMNLQPMD